MPWSGKVLGGLFGGMVGGPLGLGVGAAMGHYLADSEGARSARDQALVLRRLEWRHHAFGDSGPGVLLTPVWRARGLRGVGVTVVVSAPRFTHKAVVEPEHPSEECHLPEVLVPYTFVDDPLTVTVRVDAPRRGGDGDTFIVPLPSPVRRQGGSGPARVVMALVATARAGDRALERDDVRFIRERFADIHALDDDGAEWLRAWLKTLRDADHARLSPEKVARRLAPHLDADSTGRVLTWLMYGTRGVWPGEAQIAYVDALADALGLDGGAIAELWSAVDRPVDDEARRDALATLGLPADAGSDTIRDAWRKAVRAWHPDRHPDAPDEATRRTAALNAAYDLLTR